MESEIQSSEAGGEDAGWRRLRKATATAGTFTSVGLWRRISVYSGEQIKEHSVQFHTWLPAPLPRNMTFTI